MKKYLLYGSFLLILVSLESLAAKTPQGCAHILSQDLTQFVMRILRDETGAFETLSDDPHRRVVMFSQANVGPEFFGLTFENILASRGYTQEKIARLKGTPLRMVFVPSEAAQVVEATWANLIQILRQAYSRETARFIETNLLYLRVPRTAGMSFGAAALRHYRLLESRGPIPFRESETTKRGSKNFIDENALLNRHDLDPVWRARAFLEHELKLTELFTGEGFILTPDLKIGEREFFGLNQRLEDIPGHLTFDLR